jgi:hypothetical protein
MRSTVEADGAAKTAYLLGTPGQRRLGVVATVSCRGRLTQDGRTWAVVGAVLYEETFDPITGAATATARGAIVNDGLPVSMASNGNGGQQLAIVGGGQLKILNLLTNVLSAAVVLPLTNGAGADRVSRRLFRAERAHQSDPLVLRDRERPAVRRARFLHALDGERFRRRDGVRE